MRGNRLRWFGHVKMRLIDATVRKNDNLEVTGTSKRRGRPKKTLVEIVVKTLRHFID